MCRKCLEVRLKLPALKEHLKTSELFMQLLLKANKIRYYYDKYIMFEPWHYTLPLNVPVHSR